MSFKTIKILGIHFFKGNAFDVFDLLNKKGGLLTIPAAPALVTIPDDKAYYDALLKSDIVIPDSGFMLLIWNATSSEKLKKISGLAFIDTFINNHSILKDKNIFLINPSDIDGAINREFLNNNGFNISKDNLYTAPFYKNAIEDFELLSIIEAKKPDWIIINIGGGTQEKLGLNLKNNLSYSPAIVCSGAAIAFKTGRQVKMPIWVDKLYLGWLLRCISQPKLYIPRYLKGFRLISLILKHKNNIVA